MALSQVTYPGDGATSLFTVPFPYLSASYVKAYVDGVEVSFTWNSATVINISPAPSAAAAVFIKRATPSALRLVDFQDGSILQEASLDLNADQMFHIAQETADSVDARIFVDVDDQIDGRGKVLKDLADPINPSDAATKAYADSLIVGAGGIPILEDLSSSTVGKGAALVGVADPLGLFLSQDVEGALEEAILAANQRRVVVGSVAALRLLSCLKYSHALTSGYYVPGGGGAEAFYYDPADSTTPDNGGTVIVAADGARWKSTTPKLLTARKFGATGGGTADDAPHLRACFTAWAAATGVLGGAKMVVEAGQYRIGSSINLRTIFGASTYYNAEFDMDCGATFFQTTALSPILDFSTADGGGFAFGKFRFGGIGGGAIGGTGLIIRNISDSLIEAASISAFAGAGGGDQVGLRFICSAANGIYNNIINIGAMLSNKYGILATDTAAPPHGLQGNLFTFGHCSFNEAAIWLLNQSTSNTFAFGSLEGNTAMGVLDQAGYNIYRVNFASGDVIELGTANGRVDISGYGFTVNNTGNAKGSVRNNAAAVTPLIPALPVSNATYQNLFARPATVSIGGGTVSSITVDGVLTGLSSGSFRVPYGALLSIIYSVAPSWVWTFE
jgi:hypothetical protein